MSRRTRHDIQIPPRQRKLTRREQAAILARKLKRELIERGIIPDPSKREPRHKWAWEWGKQGGIVKADTRSQARALIKQKLGVKSTVGVQLEQIVPAPMPHRHTVMENPNAA